MTTPTQPPSAPMPAPAPASFPAAADPSPGRISTPGAIGALYRLVLRHQLTRGRLVLFGVILTICTILGWLIGRSNVTRVADTVDVVSAFGLGLIVPVVALVLGSAALGNWVEDETLVYVWLRPVARSRLALAAVAAAATVAVPITVFSLGIMAALGSGGDADALLGTVIGSTLGSLAYVAVFVALGLLVKRALLWGLVYVFIWEFFIARAGDGAARLSINSYASSLLADYSGQSIRLADRSLTASYIVLLAITWVALAFTTWRLQRANVA
ncbi:MAG: hypothetical protein AAGA93_25845 [Actinomycetota bacterium]